MNRNPAIRLRPAGWLHSEHLVPGLTVLLFVAFAPFAPSMISGANLGNILGHLLPLLVAATGMTLVLITGGIDLSVTSILALTSVVGAKLLTTEGGGVPTMAGVLVMLALGAGLGVLNGVAITMLRLPPFIVTLASMTFISGFAIWLTQSRNIHGMPPSFLAIGQRLPVALGIAASLAVVVELMLRCTVYGRWIYAAGQNAAAAHISGVPVRRMTCAAYVLSGFCAALASVMLTGRLETGSPVLGREMLLDIIGATVVGGTSLFGGKGRMMWTLFGVIFLAVLDNALNLMNLSQFSITMTKGAVILFAAVLDAIRNRLITHRG